MRVEEESDHSPYMTQPGVWWQVCMEESDHSPYTAPPDVCGGELQACTNLTVRGGYNQKSGDAPRPPYTYISSHSIVRRTD